MLKVSLGLYCPENEQNDVCMEECILPEPAPLPHQHYQGHGLWRTHDMSVSVVNVEIHSFLALAL